MRHLVAALLILVCHPAARAGEVLVAAAANFAGPMARIGEAFTAGTGHVLKVSTASTGKFYSQIVGGARNPWRPGHLAGAGPRRRRCGRAPTARGGSPG